MGFFFLFFFHLWLPWINSQVVWNIFKTEKRHLYTLVEVCHPNFSSLTLALSASYKQVPLFTGTLADLPPGLHLPLLPWHTYNNICNHIIMWVWHNGRHSSLLLRVVADSRFCCQIKITSFSFFSGKKVFFSERKYC